MSGGWLTVGWIAVFALPLVVGLAAILWPIRTPPEHKVEAIRRRIERENNLS